MRHARRVGAGPIVRAELGSHRSGDHAGKEQSTECKLAAPPYHAPLICGTRAPNVSTPVKSATLQVEHLLVGKFRPLLDELEAHLRLVAHEALDRALGVLALVLDHHDAQQGALARIHGGFLELARHHFAEALEAAD